MEKIYVWFWSLGFFMLDMEMHTTKVYITCRTYFAQLTKVRDANPSNSQCNRAWGRSGTYKRAPLLVKCHDTTSLPWSISIGNKDFFESIWLATWTIVWCDSWAVCFVQRLFAPCQGWNPSDLICCLACKVVACDEAIDSKCTKSREHNRHGNNLKSIGLLCQRKAFNGCSHE